jgi:SnoaL-like domain
LRKFAAAVEAADEQALLDLFAADATWTGDGGGRVPALPRPLVGRERIVKLILGYWRRYHDGEATIHLASVSGETGLCVRVNGQLTGVLSCEIDGERILTVHLILNPDKLAGATDRN